jgi:hypothetical protein
MHLFCCHTPAHRVLFEKVFAPSVPKGFELHSTLIEQTGPGDFLSPEFLRCIRKKLILIQESLRNFKNEILVWSDVDIRFVNLSLHVLKADFESSDTDIFFNGSRPACRMSTRASSSAAPTAPCVHSSIKSKSSSKKIQASTSRWP